MAVFKHAQQLQLFSDLTSNLFTENNFYQEETLRKWWSSIWALHHVFNQAITETDSSQTIVSVPLHDHAYMMSQSQMSYENLISKDHRRAFCPSHYLTILSKKSLTVYKNSVATNVNSPRKSCSCINVVRFEYLHILSLSILQVFS